MLIRIILLKKLQILLTLINLCWEQSHHDPALFVKRDENQNFIGIVAYHVDDFIHCGLKSFGALDMDKAIVRFSAGKREAKAFKYIGFDVKQDDYSVSLDMKGYLKDIDIPEVLPGRAKLKSDQLPTREIREFRRCVGILMVQGCRPDKSFDLVELSLKLKKACLLDLVKICKVLQHIKGEPGFVAFSDLVNPLQWGVVVFTDASLANLSDGCSSMGAHVILVTGCGRNCCVLSWQANKIKRVVRSTLAAEMLSPKKDLEEAIFLRNMIGFMGWKLVLFQLIVDSGIVDNKSRVEAIHSTKAVGDKLLRINVGAIKEFLKKGLVNSIRWCDSSTQIEDCLTKKGASGHILLEIIQSGCQKVLTYVSGQTYVCSICIFD